MPISTAPPAVKPVTALELGFKFNEPEPVTVKDPVALLEPTLML